jgi:hypothetical protein
MSILILHFTSHFFTKVHGMMGSIRRLGPHPTRDGNGANRDQIMGDPAPPSTININTQSCLVLEPPRPDGRGFGKIS